MKLKEQRYCALTVGDVLLEKRANQRVYCQCKSPDNEYKALTGSELTKRNTIQWVHATCGRPTKMVWERWLTICVVCLRLYSSPWSAWCRECHHEMEVAGPYRGWSCARRISEEFHRKLLDEGARLRYAQQVGANSPQTGPPPGTHPE